MKNKIFAIREVGASQLLLEYATNQGNRKKAFFSSEKHAQDALERYIKNGYRTKDHEWEVIELCKRVEI